MTPALLRDLRTRSRIGTEVLSGRHVNPGGNHKLIVYNDWKTERSLFRARKPTNPQQQISA